MSGAVEEVQVQEEEEKEEKKARKRDRSESQVLEEDQIQRLLTENSTMKDTREVIVKELNSLAQIMAVNNLAKSELLRAASFANKSPSQEQQQQQQQHLGSPSSNSSSVGANNNASELELKRSSIFSLNSGAGGSKVDVDSNEDGFENDDDYFHTTHQVSDEDQASYNLSLREEIFKYQKFLQDCATIPPDPTDLIAKQVLQDGADFGKTHILFLVNQSQTLPWGPVRLPRGHFDKIIPGLHFTMCYHRAPDPINPTRVRLYIRIDAVVPGKPEIINKKITEHWVDTEALRGFLNRNPMDLRTVVSSETGDIQVIRYCDATLKKGDMVYLCTWNKMEIAKSTLTLSAKCTPQLATKSNAEIYKTFQEWGREKNTSSKAQQERKKIRVRPPSNKYANIVGSTDCYISSRTTTQPNTVEMIDSKEKDNLVDGNTWWAEGVLTWADDDIGDDVENSSQTLPVTKFSMVASYSGEFHIQGFRGHLSLIDAKGTITKEYAQIIETYFSELFDH